MSYSIDWINLYKPISIGSFEAIKKIKKKFDIIKIGHAGTLDPGAEGILPIALNKSTKLISLINDKKKIYEFKIKWGESTTTDDREGKVIEISNNIPSKEMIEKNLKKFIGNIKQKPPKVSAIKVNGKRAYQRFRNNEEFDLNERIVKIYSLQLIKQINDNIYKFKVECGKGFYVRSLARDFGEILNTKAHIYSLKRIKVGNFIEKNSILLDDLLKMSEMAHGIRGFHSSISALDDIPAIEIDETDMIRNISYGNKIRIDVLPKKPLMQNVTKNYFVTHKGKVISLGKIEGKFFKPSKVLL